MYITGGFNKPSPYSCIVAVFAVILFATGIVGMYFARQGSRSEKRKVREQAEYLFNTSLTSLFGGAILAGGVLYFIRKNKFSSEK